jgi:hypothetical protein
VVVVAEEEQAGDGAEHFGVFADRGAVAAAFFKQHTPGLTLATARSAAARMPLRSLLNAAWESWSRPPGGIAERDDGDAVHAGVAQVGGGREARRAGLCGLSLLFNLLVLAGP